MGKIVETKITRFDGGIANDPRDPRENTCRMVSNFDVLTNPRKMTPYRDSVSGDDAAATSQKQNFCIALRTGTTYGLYSLGVKSGAATAQIMYKNLTTGSDYDLDDDDWTNTNNNESSSGSTNFELFVYYKNTGLIYGARSSRYVWEYEPSGGTSWADSKYDYGSTATHISQGIVHSKDDIMYFGMDNKLIKNNAGTFATALTLPANLYITSVCEYGNYLAIAMAPVSGYGNSKVFLWDRDSSLATLSESIDWGSGALTIIEEIDGVLVGISLMTTLFFNDRIVIRGLSGGVAVKLAELSGTTSTLLPIAKQKINNRLYFMMSIVVGGTRREGVWSFGRSSANSDFALIHERTPDDDTALVSGVLYNFFIVGDYMFQSYNTSSAYAISKTYHSARYTASSIYESKRFDAGDASLKKKLIGATVMTEYLPADASIVLKYRKDSTTTWTTIFTETTDNSISHSAINIESSGANLPGDYKEIEFQIISTNGAEITGLSFKEEIVDKRLY